MTATAAVFGEPLDHCRNTSSFISSIVLSISFLLNGFFFVSSWYSAEIENGTAAMAMMAKRSRAGSISRTLPSF